MIAPKGFFPVQDTGVIMGISDAPQDISFAAMSARQQALAKAILKDPAVASLSSFIGIDGTNPTLNTGRIQINLKPLDEREIDASSVIRRLQPMLDQIHGISLFMQPVQDLTVETRVSRTQFQYSLEDSRPEELAVWAPRFVQKLRELPQLRDVASDQQLEGRQVQVVIDRDTASRLGVTPQLIDNTLYDAFGQRQVSIMFTQLNQYRVDSRGRPRVPQVAARSARHLHPNDRAAPRRLTRVHRDEGDVRSRSRSITRGSSPSSPFRSISPPAPRWATPSTRSRTVKNELHMPSSIQGDFQGTAAAFLASLTNEPFLILAALVTVYIVLGVLYESYIHPITILSTLPSAGVGAVLSLLICGIDLGVIALIGIILLIGIVKKNAIMMIDFALEAERQQGMNPHEAIYQACLLRFRPIMMTTMAALLGAVPLAVGSGRGVRAAPPAGNFDHRRLVALPIAHAVHHAGHLPLL